MSLLEKFLTAEIARCVREMHQLEEEIKLYERMLRKIRKGVRPPHGKKSPAEPCRP